MKTVSVLGHGVYVGSKTHALHVVAHCGTEMVGCNSKFPRLCVLTMQRTECRLGYRCRGQDTGNHALPDAILVLLRRQLESSGIHRRAAFARHKPLLGG